MYLAQYSYNTTTTTSGTTLGIVLFVYILIGLVFITAGWKIFVKAGQPGWKILIPIYNSITLLRIVGYSPWYVLLLFVPIVNLVFSIFVAYKLALAFGYGIGMTILEFLFGIGYLILGFGSAKYLGPDGGGTVAKGQVADTPYPTKAKPAAHKPSPTRKKPTPPKHLIQ